MENKELADINDVAYLQLIESITSLWGKAKAKAVTAVNTELLDANWQTGKYIVEYEQGGKQKAEYGKKLIINLSKDLTARNGKGFSRSNLIYMRKFYLTFPKSETVSHQLTWSHYFELLKCDNSLELQFYFKESIKEGWKVRELKRQMKSCLFQRLALSTDKAGVLALANEGHQVQTPQDIIRDPFVLEFAGLPKQKRYKESDLEKALKEHMEQFLLEMGRGFAFVGRQYSMQIGSRQFKVDLVFYHCILKCYVLIDLKRAEIKHGDIGQMNLYLNYFKTEVCQPDDNPPVGIVLGARKDELLMEYALEGITNQLFVARYQLYLPKREELQAQLDKLLDETEKNSTMNGKQLKNSILQWAIQGKLVPQDPNDEPASVLLEKIRQEKERLIKEKKIKRDKNASIIFRGEDNSYYEKVLATGEVKCIDEEIPFEIPATWNWARLANITSILGDGIHGTPEYDVTGTVYFINGNNLSNGNIEIKADTKTVSEQEAEKHKRLLNSTTVLVSINGTLGNVAFYNGENVILGKSACYFNLMGNIDKQYIKHILETEYFTEYAKNVATGSTIKNVPLAGMRNFLIPVPPITEQHRIILGMVRLAHSIVRYNDAQTKLDLLNNVLNEKLKKSVLQEAIQGKLVPQLAEEGTSQELLEQIKAEKEKLVKEGKLKKSALNNTVIFRGDDNRYYEQIEGKVVEIELPFEFPSSWSIARLSSVCQLTDGQKQEGQGVLLDAKFLRGKSTAIRVDKGKFVKTGDNIILVDGENSGEVFAVPQDGYMGSTFKQLWLSGVMYAPYLLAFIRFYKDALRNSKRGAAIPHLNKELFYSLIVGIPPIQEQKRIVDKINRLTQLLK